MSALNLIVTQIKNMINISRFKDLIKPDNKQVLGFLAILSLLLIVTIYFLKPIWALSMQSKAGKLLDDYIQTNANTSQNYFTCQIPAITDLPPDENLDRAITLLETAQIIQPQFTHTSFLLGQAYCLQNDYLSAIYAGLGEFIQQRPENPLGELETAFAHFSMSLQPTISYPEKLAHQNLSRQIFERLGYSEAYFLEQAENSYNQQFYRVAWYWYHLGNIFNPLTDSAYLRLLFLEITINNNLSNIPQFDDQYITGADFDIQPLLSNINDQKITSTDLMQMADNAYQQSSYHSAWYLYKLAAIIEPLPNESAVRKIVLDLVFGQDQTNDVNLLKGLYLTPNELHNIPSLAFFEAFGLSETSFLQAADSAYHQGSYRVAWYWYEMASTFNSLDDKEVFRLALLNFAFTNQPPNIRLLEALDLDYEEMIITPSGSFFVDQGISEEEILQLADTAFQQESYQIAWFWYRMASSMDGISDHAYFRKILLDLAFNNDNDVSTWRIDNIDLNSEDIQTIVPLSLIENQSISIDDINLVADSAFQQQSYQTAWYLYQIVRLFEAQSEDASFRFALLDLVFKQKIINGTLDINDTLVLSEPLIITPFSFFRLENGNSVAVREVDKQIAGYYYYNIDSGGVIINVKNSGNYCINIAAFDQPPAPTQIEVSHNFDPVYFIELSLEDNSWQYFDLNIFLEEGFHLLSVRLSNDAIVDGIDRNALVGTFVIQACQE